MNTFWFSVIGVFRFRVGAHRFSRTLFQLFQLFQVTFSQRTGPEEHGPEKEHVAGMDIRRPENEMAVGPDAGRHLMVQKRPAFGKVVEVAQGAAAQEASAALCVLCGYDFVGDI